VKKEDSAKKESKNDQEFSKIVTERPPVQKVPEEVKDRGRNFLKQANIYLKKAKIDLSSQNTLVGVCFLLFMEFIKAPIR
jgi:hypothetical protein